MLDKNDIFPIGIGTWTIDFENFSKEIESLKYSFEKGQNYLSLYMLYNNGNVVRKMKAFIDEVGRNNLFINVNLEPTITCKDDVENQLNEYLNILNIDYVDSIQIHAPFFSNIPLKDVYSKLNELVENKKVRYIGVSNVNIEQLKEIQKISKIDFFEGVYNLECKIYEDLKILDYCKENNIQFICYQPLRRNRTALRNYECLLKLSEKYGKTQNQIILNWIIREKHIIPLVKSTNANRIKENLESLDFVMKNEDYEILNDFRNKEFDDIKIDWEANGGITIDQLANQYD